MRLQNKLAAIVPEPPFKLAIYSMFLFELVEPVIYFKVLHHR